MQQNDDLNHMILKKITIYYSFFRISQVMAILYTKWPGKYVVLFKNMKEYHETIPMKIRGHIENVPYFGKISRFRSLFWAQGLNPFCAGAGIPKLKCFAIKMTILYCLKLKFYKPMSFWTRRTKSTSKVIFKFLCHI